MKDMGKLHYCLGISISHDEENHCIFLQQKQYILNMLKRFGLAEAKTVSTPADLNVTLVRKSTLCCHGDTRPDTAQSVGVVSKFNSNPSEAYLTAVKRILHYLKSTVDLALKYQKQEDESLIGYSDADWAGDCDDRHSTTGLMAGGTISWLNKKQVIVALSTSEAEYVALSSATQEAAWFRKLLSDLGEPPLSVTIMEDN